MISDKMKELREWGTFWMSVATVVAIPVGLLILSNQRLQIMKEVGEKYVTSETYKTGMAEQAKSQGKIEGKLDSMFIEQIHMSDTFQTLKDQINNRK